MKNRIFSLIIVVMLVMMMLPADIVVARGHGGHGPGATNETNEATLVADFVFDDPECPLCEGITFTDQSSGGIGRYTYDWDFGDGTRHSKAQNPTHYYAGYGNYTVTLTVTDGARNAASTSKTVTLAPTEIIVEPLSSNSSTKAVVSTWPRCISGCTANDASITYIWLLANPNCTPGTPTSAELWATFDVNRGKGICCVVSVVDIYVGGNLIVDDYITDVGDLVPGGTTYNVKITDITWTCGSELTLKDVYAQWILKGGQPCPTCNGDCTDYNIPSKCYYDAGPYEVHTPLVADFEFTDVCSATTRYSLTTQLEERHPIHTIGISVMVQLIAALRIPRTTTLTSAPTT